MNDERASMTRTAKRFLEAVELSWDSPEPWQNTAERGLSQYDQHVVRCWARKEGERPSIAEREIVKAARERVTR